MNRNLGFKQNIPKQGYKLGMQPTSSLSFKHFFCGLPEIKGAISPYTGKPLLRFLSLDTSDPRLELGAIQIPRIELLYSWTCTIAYIDFFYKIYRDRIEILNLNNEEVYSEADFHDFPYPNYPLSFPKSIIDLIPVDENEKNIVNSINETQDLDLRLQYPELSEPYHQIGGEPYFVQKPEVLSCPECGKDMSFFASIGNNNGHNIGFVDNDYVQVVYQICKDCCIFGVYNICD